MSAAEMDHSIDEGDPFAAAATGARDWLDHCGTDRFDVALVCGSGLSAIAERFTVAHRLPMPSIGLPVPGVQGHSGEVLDMPLGGGRVMVLAGRVHLYEGHSVQSVVAAVRLAAAAGVRRIILTNAAGSLHPEWPPGQCVLISDHINLSGQNPLSGADAQPGGISRFVDMSEAYDKALRERARKVDQTLPEGVYAALLGPSYETPAEIRMLAAMGADLVGMSTACENIAARHVGMDVLGLSLATNLAAGLGGKLSHGEVAQAAAAAGDRLTRLLAGLCEELVAD